MIIFATLLVGSGLVIKTADPIPNLDVKSTCRAAIELAGSTGRTVDSCVAGEMGARKELEKDWSKFPAAERNQCIQTAAKGGSPSYVEIIVCLEMMRDSRVRKEPQKEQTQATKPTSTRKP
jgi:hypothetical protein